MSKPLLLLTGASSGVGLSLAGHLGKRFTVIALARRVERMRAAFGADGAVQCHGIDLSDLDALDALLDTILERCGPIRYLVNNAGAMHKAETTALDSDALAYALRLNALAPHLIMRRLLPGMRDLNFGRIVNVTSGAPFNCFPGFGAYSASKAALNALTVTAARENQEFDIRINLMSPGPVRTEMAPDAALDPSICHPTADHLLSLERGGPTGRFFWLGHEIPLAPDLAGVDWLNGRADARFPNVLQGDAR